MQRRTENDSSVMSSLRDLPFVRETFEVGLVKFTSVPTIACSSDGMSLIDISGISGEAMPVLRNSVDYDGCQYPISSIGVNKMVSAASVGGARPYTTPEPLLF